MKIHDTLSEALGIEFEPQLEEKKKSVPAKKVEQKLTKIDAKSTELVTTDPLGKDAEDDYNLSRQTFRNLIEKGNSAIDELMDLASRTEEARKFEVLATMIKTVSEATKDLYDLQKKTKDLMDLKTPEKDKGEPGSITVEKAVFVGTSSDLLRQVKGIKKEG